MKEVTIIGAGLIGSVLSVFLAKRGYKVKVYERRPDMRKTGSVSGRSINLALSDRGWKALDEIGVSDEIRNISLPMKGRLIHLLNSETEFQPYGWDGQAIYSVSRGDLNMKLISFAEKQHGVKFIFNKKCIDLDLETSTIIFEDGETRKNSELTSDIILGADGAFSMVRRVLQKVDRFDYSQNYLKHGYKELEIPADFSNKWRIAKDSLHIWPRESFMMIALPNFDGSFTCTLFLPFKGENSFESLRNKHDVNNFFSTYFPDALELLPTLTDDFFNNPTSSLATIRCYPWSYKNSTLLLGDAAHAIVPFFGQGMNCGFEDCMILNQLFDKHHDDWGKVIPDYEQQRKTDTDAIADLALRNFIEMRDWVAHPEFSLLKKIERKLHENFKEQWLPLYSMVTFSEVPYAHAMKEGYAQFKRLEEVLKIPSVEKFETDDDIWNKITSILDLE